MVNQPFNCPVCGAEVPARAAACPDCGADEKTGWSDNTIYDGTGIEDPQDFDYAGWQRRELGRRGGRDWWWWGIGVLLLLAVVLWFVL